MEGLDQAIKTIAEMAKQTLRTNILKTDESSPRKIIIAKPDGSMEDRVLDPAPHCEKLVSPDELLAFIEKYKQDNSVIYISQQGIEFVYDFESRRDTAFCLLSKTHRLKTLEAWSVALPWMTQKDIVRALRIDLRDCVSASLVQLFRQVRFASSVNGDAEIQHGKESMGRAITAAVKGTDVIPEEVVVDLQYFEEIPEFRPRLGCAIEIDVETQRFRMSPFPGQLEYGYAQVLMHLKEKFEVDGMPPVFIGRK